MEVLDILSQFFVICESPGSDDDGDDSAATDYYKFLEPEELEFWSVTLIPMTSFINFTLKFKSAQIPTCITMKDKVVAVSFNRDEIHVKCETWGFDNPYRFTIVVDNRIHPFHVAEFIDSLQNSEYEKLISEMEKLHNEGYWRGKDNGPLKAKAVANKVQQILVSLDQLTAINKAVAIEKKEAARSMTPFASQGSVRTGSGRVGSRPTPEPATQRKLRPQAKRAQAEMNPTPSGSRAKRAKLQVDDSLASALTAVPRDRNPGEEIDYTESTNNFKNFWTECTECYVLDKVDDKVQISIDKLERAPDTWTIRAFEEKGMNNLKHYYLELPDKNNRQTICVMPKGLTSRPKSWDDIKDGDFLIINGQHSVEASKRIQKDNSVEPTVKEIFKTWNAFVVWSLDEKKLRTISAFYNRCNHFSIFSPTWATNILASRSLWLNYGMPTAPLPKSETGRSSKKDAQTARNDGKWKVLSLAV